MVLEHKGRGGVVIGVHVLYRGVYVEAREQLTMVDKIDYVIVLNAFRV